MESNFRNKDFEQYIKDNADQYRMFPSEKVWKGINNTLHTRRKWYGAGLAFLLLLTGTAVTWVMVSYPVSKDQSSSVVKNNAIAAVKQTPEAVSPEIINNVLPFSKSAVVPKRMILTPARIITPVTILDEPVKLGSISAPEQVVVTNERSQSVVNIPRKTIAAVNNDFIDEMYELQTATPAAAGQRAFRTQSSDRPSGTDALSDLSFENVTSTYISRKDGKKISWQLFITPTISYRKLNENTSFENALSAGFPFASLTDVNKAVTHKPDMGLQIGIAARFPVTRNFKIRGGLQFNINRYDIKAFAYNQEVATINLNEPNGINSVSALTNFRTFNGYKSDWLKNFYFSVSAPIGAEMKLIGNRKTYLGVAGTIQPTYIIKDRAYLISTDYKNYAKVPSLIRHVNVNTSFETFVSYLSGKTRWQIGPQVRYQVLSSFHNKYPVKENLFDFGLKVGLTLNE